MSSLAVEAHRRLSEGPRRNKERLQRRVTVADMQSLASMILNEVIDTIDTVEPLKKQHLSCMIVVA